MLLADIKHKTSLCLEILVFILFFSFSFQTTETATTKLDWKLVDRRKGKKITEKENTERIFCDIWRGRNEEVGKNLFSSVFFPLLILSVYKV